MNILIVDDEVSALRDLARTIEKTVQDAEIKKADRALDALSLCREQEFDVVFLDIRMPGKDGLELAKEIKQVRPLINIIMVTAYQQYLYDAVKLYVSDYILKPARAERMTGNRGPIFHRSSTGCGQSSRSLAVRMSLCRAGIPMPYPWKRYRVTITWHSEGTHRYLPGMRANICTSMSGRGCGSEE